MFHFSLSSLPHFSLLPPSFSAQSSWESDEKENSILIPLVNSSRISSSLEFPSSLFLHHLSSLLSLSWQMSQRIGPIGWTRRLPFFCYLSYGPEGTSEIEGLAKWALRAGVAARDEWQKRSHFRPFAHLPGLTSSNKWKKSGSRRDGFYQLIRVFNVHTTLLLLVKGSNLIYDWTFLHWWKQWKLAQWAVLSTALFKNDFFEIATLLRLACHIVFIPMTSVTDYTNGGA